MCEGPYYGGKSCLATDQDTEFCEADQRCPGKYMDYSHKLSCSNGLQWRIQVLRLGGGGTFLGFQIAPP